MPDTLSDVARRGGLFPGVAPRASQMFDLSGVPGMNGPTGMIAQMFIQPFLSQLYSQMGMVPGQFLPTQNLMDFNREREFFTQHQGAMRLASEADRETYVRMLRGVAHMSGTPFGPGQMRAAQTIAGDMAAMGPIMASMMPNLFDELHGHRGSAQVMAHYMHMGGRYGVDPITGRTGLSGQSAGEMTRVMHQRIFGEGANLAQLNGLSAGRAGQLYDEMLRRGHMGGGRTMGAEERQKLLDNPMLADKERTLEATRIADRIKNLSGVVAAMRDIFGDMGKPNAPMAELISGLQSLTQGGLATMNVHQLEMTARQVHNVGRASGMGVEGMMRLMSVGAAQADQMGLDRQYVVQATLGGAAFGHAFGNFGRGDVAGFGRRDKEGVTVIDQQLRLRAANSTLAHQFNAALRLADETPFNQNSEFGRFVQAIKSGQTTYDADGKGNTRSVLMTPEQLRNMAGAAGIDAATFNDIRARTSANQEYGVKYGTADVVRRLQGDADINPILRSVSLSAIRGSFGNIGQETASRMANIATQTLRNMDASVRVDANARNNAVADAIWSELSPEDQARIGSKANLTRASTRIWAGFEQRVRSSPRLRGYGGAHAALDLHNPVVLAEAENFRAEQEGTAKLQGAMAGLGRGGPLRRLMSLMESAPPGKPFGELAAEVFGGVPMGEVTGALSPLMTELNTLQSEYTKLPPRERVKRANILRRINELVGSVRDVAGKHGLVVDQPVTPDQIGLAMQSTTDMRMALRRAGGATGTARTGHLNEAKYQAGMAMRRSDTVAGTLLMSDTGMQVLGQPGLNRIMKIHENNRRLRALAEEQGVSVEELMMSGDAGVQNLLTDNDTHMAFIRDRMTSGRKAKDGEAVDMAAVRAARDTYGRTDKQITATLIGALGETVRDPAERTAIEKAVGQGDRRFKVQASLAALQRVQAAKRAGRDVAADDLELAKPFLELTEGGRIADARAIQRAVESFKAGRGPTGPDAARRPDKPQRIEIVITSGSVELKNGKLAFSNVKGTGTTPVENT